jgi:hypothetical protein
MPAVRCRDGFSLVELLLVLSSLFLVMLVGTAAMLGSLKIEKASRDSLQRLTWRSELADRFRADVNEARSAPARVANLTADASCLILQMPKGTFVAYRLEKQHATRAEFAVEAVPRQWASLGPECAGISFQSSQGPRPVVKLRIDELIGPNNLTRPLELAAALGGNWQ